MKRILGLLIISLFATTLGFTEPANIFCRTYKHKKPFALRWPNLAVCLDAAQPYDEIVGTIEWCRKSYTRMGADECGRTIQWRATDITYRYVLCNGAYGECFTRTQQDGPIEYVTASETATSEACAEQSGGKQTIFK
jgi:hypothetical protein